MCSISTRTDLTDHSINARPWAAACDIPTRPSGRYDETGSAASSTNTCRSHEVTGISAPTGLCWICGAQTTRRDQWNADHVIPRTASEEAVQAAGLERHPGDS